MTHSNNNCKHERVKNFIRYFYYIKIMENIQMKKLIKRNFYNITFIIANAVNSIIVVNNEADWSTPSEYIKARILPIMILPALMGLIFILAEKRKE
ncbi:hypothetical protein predicted by Glimmer/Critica [Ruminococcus bicirculans (ex Wegman et al. 2014)]|uniref:Uncharacterized protein n=2 Tax=Oscillospiraceae TaxID=216572 RepID=A0ABP1WL08_9FIRM|nr:hypothetical protein predicted by Glimmer/Critica [Ruminococcus bicirculans (ex Wegman et al. 2014)]